MPSNQAFHSKHKALGLEKGELVFTVHVGVQKVAYSGTGLLSAMERTVRRSSALNVQWTVIPRDH